jgi:nucleoside-diphosphate-sugar epimerase
MDSLGGNAFAVKPSFRLRGHAFTTTCTHDMSQSIVNQGDRVAITGAAGFLGRRVVAALLDLGFQDLLCLLRPSPVSLSLKTSFGKRASDSNVHIFRGNLLSKSDCQVIADNARVIIHLAAGRGEKSFPDAFLNSVVTTRNLLDACAQGGVCRRFVNISSFAVYSNQNNPRGNILDETAPMEADPFARGQAYCYAKVRQDELVMDYGRKHKIPYVLIRPGVIYGPGNEGIHSRVGIGRFGVFLHCGGGNKLPLSYVDNCADAIVLAATRPDVDGEVFNIVDDDLPSSRAFLRGYKRSVKNFRSIYIPHSVSYLACLIWEKYNKWSNGQLPSVFNRGTWRSSWKKTRYTNGKLKKILGWTQRIPTPTGLRLHYESCRSKELPA